MRTSCSVVIVARSGFVLKVLGAVVVAMVHVHLDGQEEYW